MKLLRRHRLSDQRGAAVLEFALVAPLILLIFFGIIEFSILLHDKAMLTNASREGARAGIVFVPGRSATATATEAAATMTIINGNIESVIRKYCETNLISFSSSSSVTVPTPIWIDVDGNGNNWEAGDSLEVTVNYDFNFMVFSGLVNFFGGNLSDVFNLKAVTEMRLE